MSLGEQFGEKGNLLSCKKNPFSARAQTESRAKSNVNVYNQILTNGCDNGSNEAGKRAIIKTKYAAETAPVKSLEFTGLLGNLLVRS